jgi:hypothetical protein
VKKYIPWILSGLILVSLVTGCSGQLDKKLDEEYQSSKFEVEVMLDEVDSIATRMDYVRSVHDEQDMKINKQGISIQDRKIQASHVTWFENYQPELEEIRKWVQDSREVIAAHQDIEATHNRSNSKKIRADHELMQSELEQIKTEAEQYRSDLFQAKDTIETFFSDHADLMKKYDVPSEHGVKPPTSK